MSDKYLKSLTFPDLADRYVVGDSSLSVSGAAADAKATGDALATKAEVDGAYESMTVGNAEQLVGTTFEEDSVPYNFRTSGGSIDIGDREYLDKIVGGTVAWNQFVENGNFADKSGWSGTPFDVSNNVATLTFRDELYNHYLSRSNIAIVSGHKYFVTVTVQSADKPNNIRFYFGNSYITVTENISTKKTVSAIYNGASTSTDYFRIRFADGTGGGTATMENAMLIDLTQAFGSAIADYIYSLEQANAGAGVAWFKKLFPKDYYPYNAGQLISVKTSSHDTVGFNQWDEEWELGAINDTTGQNSTSSTQIRSKNYIRIFPNTAYYFKSSAWAAFYYYDADKNFVLREVNFNASRLFTTPLNAYYMRFVENANYGTTYNHDICINLSWSGYRNGEYEPYEKHSYPLDNSLTLRGIPKLDASNNLYYDGDEYASDGSVSRRYGIVDLGTLTWGLNNANQFFATLPDGSPSSFLTNAVCSKYIVSAHGAYDVLEDKTVTITTTRVWAYDTAYSTAADFKTAMSGVYLVYELATPTTETAEPYQQVQICDDFGTEEFVSDSIVPVGHETRYPANLRDKLQHLPDLADADGYYMISQQNNNMSLELFRIPKAPTTDGNYTLKATVSGGTPTYTWESESEGE